jgi:UDP-glucose 4-epimerase
VNKNMKTLLVTGGAGFIGVNLIEQLLNKGYRVLCLDNFSLGRKGEIACFFQNPNFFFYETDVSSIQMLLDVTKDYEIDYIFHLAANSDIQRSAHNPGIDYKNTFLTSYSVLELMRQKKIRKMFFASTSAVYGEQPGIKIPETGSLSPISYYGGAKMAAEAFISSYAYMNDFDVTVFRFPNVIGPRLTHGVVFDFMEKLKKNNKVLEILGDGTQAKPYIYVDDLIEAMLMIALSNEKRVNIYNIGVKGVTSVREIADMVCAKLNLHDVTYRFTGGDRGWKGDVPMFQYDVSKVKRRGWSARYNSNQAVHAALDAIIPQGAA